MTLDDSPLATMPSQRVDRRLLRNDVFQLLLERILCGEFEPGMRLKDSDLTDWLHVSRTPVREALGRLAHVGLVSTAPNRYTIVAPLVPEEVAATVRLLTLVYPDAVAEACDRATVELELELDLLATRLERDPQAQPVELLRRVLGLVVSALQNRVLADLLDSLQLRVFRYLYLFDDATDVVMGDRVARFARALANGSDDATEELLEIMREVGLRASRGWARFAAGGFRTAAR
jgi:DNA-binding GntR family transcriptional regulator